MLTDKVLTLALGLFLMLAIACGDAVEKERPQQGTNPPAVRELSRSAAFLDYAASTNILHAELAGLATERAQSEQVKTLGQEMLDFYTKSLQALQQVARAEGLQASLPDSLGSADRATIEEFRKLPQAEFDERYRQYVNSSHQSQLEHYQQMLLKAEEEEIRKWVNEMQLQLRARMQLTAQHENR